MRATRRILRYELHNVLRSRTVLVYAALLFLLTDALFRFGGSGARVVLSLLNVVLILVPLVSALFGTMHVRRAEFTGCCWPSRRPAILFTGHISARRWPVHFAGVGLRLSARQAGGPPSGAAPDAARGGGSADVVLRRSPCCWPHFDDRAKGLGGAILVWLACAIIYDGLILLIVSSFSDYPLERAVLALTLMNPVDLGRVLLLLQFDTAALMGYTGAVFERFFGSTGGRVAVLAALVVQAVVPLALALRVFRRKDF
jgi:Cu-processing system permease protein